MPELQKYKGAVYLWDYVPSLPLAISFAILFTLLTILHIYKMFRSKLWFCIPFVIGGICEPIGYLSRALATNNTASLVLYLLQALFLLLPPVLFAASLYMVYSRIVRSVNGARFSIISPRLCTRIFVLGDWICLNIQSTGGGLTANEKLVHIGDPIVVAGLGIQIIIFVGFMYCCILFHIRFKRYLKESGESVDVPWESVVNMLYVNSLLISVRNVFRLIEYVMGKGSYLFAHEWPIYVFDGALMAVVMMGFAARYPDLLRRGRTESMIELRSEDQAVDEREK